jgi:transcription antitermination factor NusG
VQRASQRQSFGLVSFPDIGAPFGMLVDCTTSLRYYFPAISSSFSISPAIVRRSVNSATGVSLIMGAEQPISVPCGVVEALIARRESSGMIRLDRDLKVRERVRIISGPFAETLCRKEHLDDRGRVRVLLEIMGGQVVAQLDRSAFRPVA